MPLYEYRCDSCHKLREVIQKFSDPPLSVCEECGGELTRLFSPPSLHFKGSGWYVNDYGKKGKDNHDGKPAKTETKTEVKSESKTEASKDTKPATKSDAKTPAGPTKNT